LALALSFEAPVAVAEKVVAALVSVVAEYPAAKAAVAVSVAAATKATVATKASAAVRRSRERKETKLLWRKVEWLASLGLLVSCP
jgi:hypothetical protein